jgi:hypothetical protein
MVAECRPTSTECLFSAVDHSVLGLHLVAKAELSIL